MLKNTHAQLADVTHLSLMFVNNNQDAEHTWCHVTSPAEAHLLAGEEVRQLPVFLPQRPRLVSAVKRLSPEQNAGS